MADNVTKATLDAIAESDNEIGGQLLTRLREKAKWGANDAYLETANSTRISVPSGSGWFESWMVDCEIDILAKSTPTGQEGRYTVLTVDSSGDYCTVEVLGGGAPGFTDEDPVQIRLATLLVETTYQFLDPATHVTDDHGALWVGLEKERVTYDERYLSPGASEFRQLGDPDTGEGYLTLDHAPRTEITEASQSYSALDKLRRAMLVDYATEDELDRVGRNLAVIRPRGMSDDTFREVIKALAFLPKGTTYGIEMLLDAMYPSGGWEIYEDLVNYNNTVFILLPVMEPGQDPEGRAFLDSEEEQDSASTTTVTVEHTPISVAAVVLDDVELSLGMTVLPSADTVPWSYVNEGDTEGNTFSVVSNCLQHVQGPGDALGGRYSRTEDELGIAFPPGCPGQLEQVWRVDIDWIGDTVTTSGGYPWMITVTDGVFEYTLMWDEAGFALGQSDETTVVTGGEAPGTATWHRMTLLRRGSKIRALMDGRLQLEADRGDFAADATKAVSFGYWNNSNNQDWTVRWDNAAVRIASRWRNFWNLYSETGALSNANANLTDGSNPFVAGDSGKYVRIYSDNALNDGLWLATYVGAGTLTLAAVPFGPGATGTWRADSEALSARVSTPNPANPDESFVILEEPWFRPVDVGKSVVITDSALGNDGTYPITDWIDPYSVMVDATGLGTGFTAESDLTWKFDVSAYFTTESNVKYELIDAGTVATKTLTVRQAWPNTAQPVVVNYTSVLSMQLMRDETVENEGSGGVEPGIFWPFYLWDIDQGIRDLLDAITAAGVIPEFERDW